RSPTSAPRNSPTTSASSRGRDRRSRQTSWQQGAENGRTIRDGTRPPSGGLSLLLLITGNGRVAELLPRSPGHVVRFPLLAHVGRDGPPGGWRCLRGLRRHEVDLDPPAYGGGNPLKHAQRMPFIVSV